MTNTFTYTTVDLADVIDNLNERDQAFARSLIDKAGRFGASDKQAFWIDNLTKKAKGELEQPVRPTVQVGDLANVIALFDRAKAKFPKIKILVGDQVVVISRAGEKSKVPGSLSIQSEGRYGENTWFGRITVDGNYQPTVAATPALAEALKAFAAAPAEEAAKFGKKTGRCCFCKIPLGEGKSRLSVEVGYGPDCAKNYGLPWGVKAARAAQDEPPAPPADYEAACETEEARRYEARAY